MFSQTLLILAFHGIKSFTMLKKDIARAEAEVNKASNLELLDPEYKRLIEIKCVEFEDLMEGEGFSEEEASQRCKYYSR
ncbi:unnamed protein product [Meloidogyne enterolobii]|uniref:Uncharacterized protein n=1 Tax=Meloidogyne enterolobii TaxID=390850 RepID=A0ACB0ZYC9_MELEN